MEKKNLTTQSKDRVKILFVSKMLHYLIIIVFRKSQLPSYNYVFKELLKLRSIQKNIKCVFNLKHVIRSAEDIKLSF